EDGPLLPGATAASPATLQLVDDEVRRIIDESEHDVLLLLERERDRLESLTRTLLECETLDGPDAYAAAGLEWTPPAPEEEARATTIAPERDAPAASTADSE